MTVNCEDNNWLVCHTRDNVWCDPSNDHKVTVGLARISEPAGETYGMRVSEYSIKLPTVSEWYHVYQIGNLSASYVGIKELWDGWSRLDRVINEYGVNIKVYSADGRTYPLSLVWIRQLPNDNVILAIKNFDKQMDLQETKLFACFYDGEFRHSSGYSDSFTTTIFSDIMQNQMVLENTFRAYQNEKSKPGQVQAYVNGYAVENLDSESAEVWDYVEFVRDGIVKESHDFMIKDLTAFNSKLDAKRKYLLHPPKGCEDIEFTNDVEIFLYNGNDGRYFPIHFTYTLRQVTHHDFSIDTHVVNEILQAAGWKSSDDVKLRLNVRYSGINRELIYEHTQLRELYKMSDECIYNAMAGINSTVVEWQAATLENSLYNRIMATRYTSLNRSDSTKMYGYHAISKYIADCPLKCNKDGSFRLPPLVRGKVSVFEYTEDGRLLGVNVIDHIYESPYRAVNADCKLIEPLIGEVSDEASIYYDAKDFTLKPCVNYRFYKTPKKNGDIPYRVFEDITDTDQYSIVDGKVVWTFDTDIFMATVVSDERILYYTHNANLVDGVIDFNVVSDQSANGFSCPYAPAALSLSIGDHQLIAEVDYHVEWPRIVIFSKERLGSEDNFSSIPVKIRAIGLGAEYKSSAPGFVIDGILSNDNRFDLRDSKVVRIVVDGKLRHRDDVIFREDTSVSMHDVTNGLPYVVDNTMVPLRNIIDREKSEYELRTIDEELEGRVEDYLSVFIPQAPTVEHNPIPRRYRLFSVLLNKIIHDLDTGILNPVEDDERNLISTAQFDTIMKPYLKWLDIDPIRLGVDTRYLVVEPHAYETPIQLSPLDFSLVERVNDRYLGNKIVLNKLLAIKG